MLSYVIGACAGIAFGGIAGALKVFFIWIRYLKKNEANVKEQEQVAIYGRMMSSYFANIAILVAAFGITRITSVEYVSFIIGTAAALVAANKSMRIVTRKMTETKEEI